MAVTRGFFDPNISRKEKYVKNHLIMQERRDVRPLFSLIEFNLCGLCNRSCSFCPRSNPKVYPNRNKHIPVALYEKVMADLKSVAFNGSILYSAFSEPLLYKNLEDIIKLSKYYCPQAGVEIVTNGDFVTSQKLFQLFAAGLTTLCISMYDGAHQIEHFEKLKIQAGLRNDQLIFRVRYLSSQDHFGITLSNRAGALEMKDIGISALKEPLRKPCHYPFYQIFIDYDGAVLLCAHDWQKRLIVGNVNDDSILNIWDNDILKQVRTDLINNNRNFPPCDLCDVKGVLIGRNYFDKWKEYYEEELSIKG